MKPPRNRAELRGRARKAWECHAAGCVDVCWHATSDVDYIMIAKMRISALETGERRSTREKVSSRGTRLSGRRRRRLRSSWELELFVQYRDGREGPRWR